MPNYVYSVFSKGNEGKEQDNGYLILLKSYILLPII